jgi:FMN phosphatase YigB (HAD superfamily)
MAQARTSRRDISLTPKGLGYHRCLFREPGSNRTLLLPANNQGNRHTGKQSEVFFPADEPVPAGRPHGRCGTNEDRERWPTADRQVGVLSQPQRWWSSHPQSPSTWWLPAAVDAHASSRESGVARNKGCDDEAIFRASVPVKIAVDMDNTLFDELGKEIRPGILRLLSDLRGDGHELVLWTSSTRARARQILKWHDCERYFSDFYFREDYDPDNAGVVKDVRHIGADAIIDDDPKHCRAAVAAGRIGILVASFRGGNSTKPEEMEAVSRRLRAKEGRLTHWFKAGMRWLGIWNTERRRDTALGLKDLTAWFGQAMALNPPLRRKFHPTLPGPSFCRIIYGDSRTGSNSTGHSATPCS